MKTVKKKTKQKGKTWGSFDRAKGRKIALAALKELRGVQRKMASDPSVSELTVNQFTYTLQMLDECLEITFPDPASISNAKITGLFEGEE